MKFARLCQKAQRAYIFVALLDFVWNPAHRAGIFIK